MVIRHWLHLRAVVNFFSWVKRIPSSTLVSEWFDSEWQKDFCLLKFCFQGSVHLQTPIVMTSNPNKTSESDCNDKKYKQKYLQWQVSQGNQIKTIARTRKTSKKGHCHLTTSTQLAANGDARCGIPSGSIAMILSIVVTRECNASTKQCQINYTFNVSSERK